MSDNETAEQARARGAAEEAASLARAAAEQARAQSEIKQERTRAEPQGLTQDELDRRSRADDMDEGVPDKDTPVYVEYLERAVERHRAAEARRQSASAAAHELAGLGLQKTVDGLTTADRMKLYKRPEPYGPSKKQPTVDVFYSSSSSSWPVSRYSEAHGDPSQHRTWSRKQHTTWSRKQTSSSGTDALCLQTRLAA